MIYKTWKAASNNMIYTIIIRNMYNKSCNLFYII